ncbi:MAG: putative metal-binding motif-containing protein [Desulfobacterales bacterium]
MFALIALLIAPAVTAARDGDGDGFDSKVDDCNDRDSAINPDAIEICDDGLDNDCNTFIDGADPVCGGGGGVVDTDQDGFPDSMEQANITLPNGLVLAETGATFISPCTGVPDEGPCVDANKPDLFVVILYDGTGTNIPSDPLAILRNFTNSLGIPVVPHELVPSGNNFSRDFFLDGSLVQNAVVVEELMDTDFGPLGFAPTGTTPFDTSTGVVELYTERIRAEIGRLCSSAVICTKTGCTDTPVGTCQSDDGSATTPAELISLYILNVLAHEVWHVCSLAPQDSPEVVLYHFDPNTGKVMEQSIGTQATKGKNDTTATVTLFISDSYDAVSREKYKLK